MNMRFVPMDLVRAGLARATFSTGLDSNKVILAQPPDLSALERLQESCNVLDYRKTPRTDKQARGRPHGRMKLTKTVGIMLHQTAADIADEHRLLSIPSHCAVSDEAHAVLLQPLNAYMHHGHGGNRFCLSIEVVCRADGIFGMPETFWRSKDEINGYTTKSGRWVPPKSREELRREATDAQLATARFMVRYLCEAVREMGEATGVDVRIKVIMAHRQTARKAADPGSRIWQEVGEWALAQRDLDLKVGPVLGRGQGLATAWTGRGDVWYDWDTKGF